MLIIPIFISKTTLSKMSCSGDGGPGNVQTGERLFQISLFIAQRRTDRYYFFAR